MKTMVPVSLRNETLVDLTNFLFHPRRTGIQRYFSEILANWPAGQSLIPFYLTEDQQIALLNPDIIRSIFGYIRAENRSRVKLHDHAILHYRENPLHLVSSLELTGVKAILLPELTYLRYQLAFYKRWLSYFPEKIVFIVYDFIPWLAPQFFPAQDFSGPDGYINVLQGVENFAFISHKAERDAETRVLRRPLKNSLVLAGGADGLPGATRTVAGRQTSVPEFVMVGTVELRKQHLNVLDVCEALWESGTQFFLTFVGGLGDFFTPDQVGRLKTLERSCPWFRWEKSVLDTELVEIVRGATATIYASIEEGLGLPVMESLWLNVPVIAHHTLPVLDYVPKGGVRLIDMARPGTLAEAIRAFLVPGVAQGVQAEIDRAGLPVWRDVAARLQAWLAQLPEPSPPVQVSALRRLEMIRLLHDLRLVPAKRLPYEAFALVYKRAPTGAELGVSFERLGTVTGGVEAVVERVVTLAAADGRISAAESTAWLMSLEAAQALPEDFSFTPPVKEGVGLIGRGIELLRPLLHSSDEHFLTLAYRATLGREPDPPGEADFRRFLADHAQEPRWARGAAVKALAGSEEGLAYSGEPGLPDMIEDLMLIDVFSDEEGTCFEHVADGVPSRWLFGRLIELRTLVFMRLATALFEGRRVSEVQVENPSREYSRAEKLDFLRNLYRDDDRAARLISWVASVPSDAAAETPAR